jgi:hypothetical protein
VIEALFWIALDFLSPVALHPRLRRFTAWWFVAGAGVLLLLGVLM